MSETSAPSSRRRTAVSGSVAAVAVVVLANVAGLLHAAYNRSERRSAIELTERELPLVHPGWGEERTAGYYVRLQWVYVSDDSAADDVWSDPARLAELGFKEDVWRMPHPAPERRTALPRRGYVVFEYDGAAWREWSAEYVRQRTLPPPGTDPRGTFPRDAAADPAALRRAVESEIAAMSRLVPIDVGRDESALRRRYGAAGARMDAAASLAPGAYAGGGGFMIVPAVLRVQQFEEPRRRAGRDVYARIYLSEVSVDEIYVPRGMRGPLRVARLDQEAPTVSARPPAAPRARFKPPPPRYAVTLAYGTRDEPWVVAVRSLR